MVHCTYDPATKAGSGFTERKVKGTIHWVPAKEAVKAEVRLYENLVDEENGVYNKEDGSLNLNPIPDCSEELLYRTGDRRAQKLTRVFSL